MTNSSNLDQDVILWLTEYAVMNVHTANDSPAKTIFASRVDTCVNQLKVAYAAQQ